MPSVEDFKQGFVESMNFFAGVKQNKIDVLAANIRVFDSKGENISFEASHIYNFGSVKVGVIGFVSEDVKVIPFYISLFMPNCYFFVFFSF